MNSEHRGKNRTKEENLDAALSQAHTKNGLTLANAGNATEAIVEFKAALAVDPWNNQALKNLALAFRKTGDFSSSISSYRRLVVLDSLNADVYNSLGSVQEAAGEFQPALEAYTEAIRLDPSAWWPRYNVAAILLKQRRVEPAIMQLHKVLTLHPGLPEANQLLAKANRIRNRHHLSEKLGRTTRRFLRKRPEDGNRLRFREIADNLSSIVTVTKVPEGCIEPTFDKAGTLAALSVIEQEFTVEWLSMTMPPHEIKRGWKLARRFVQDAGDVPVADMEIAAFIKLASDLSWARTLPEYKPSILMMLKGSSSNQRKHSNIEKVKYEAYVASVLAHGIHKAEFVPRSTTRTPDLKILHSSKPIFVECKRKDAYILAPDAKKVCLAPASRRNNEAAGGKRCKL